MSDTYCPLPWTMLTSTTNGSYRPCCEFVSQDNKKRVLWNQDIELYEEYIEPIKQQLLNNQKPLECKRCWDREERGLESQRTRHLHEKGQTYNSIDLKLGNKCNLGCRHCEANSSSVLQSEINRNPNEDWTETQVSDARINFSGDNWVDAALDKITKMEGIKQLKFTGGEPLYIPKVKDLIKNHPNKKDISIDIVTNGLLFTEEMANDLDGWKDVLVNVSVDAIKDHYSYVRWPGKWEDLEPKLDLLATKKHWRINICISVSAWNIWHLPETILYFKKKGFMYDLNFVDEPIWQHPWVYPESLRNQIINKFENYSNQLLDDLVDVVKFTKPYDEKLYKEFLKQKEIKDRLRKQTFEFG